jgi:hypothetical protein
MRRALTVANAVRAAHATRAHDNSKELGLLQMFYEHPSRDPSNRF